MAFFHKRGVILIAVVFLSGGSPFAFSGQVDFCKIFGSVYVEKSPQKADYRVFKEESEVFSTLKVFPVDARPYADKEGLWHFTDKKEFADFSIYYEPKRALADFSVYFIDVESFAGCND
ncbi:MAG: DUF6150 family protein [Cyclobacteriaceae bacterium]|nr:DUF6150 family protein [Cyclobacteriaceae bacterium]